MIKKREMEVTMKKLLLLIACTAFVASQARTCDDCCSPARNFFGGVANVATLGFAGCCNRCPEDRTCVSC